MQYFALSGECSLRIVYFIGMPHPEDPQMAFERLVKLIMDKYTASFRTRGSLRKESTLNPEDAALLRDARKEAMKKKENISNLQKGLKMNKQKSDRDKKRFDQEQIDLVNSYKKFVTTWRPKLAHIPAAATQDKVKYLCSFMAC